MRLAIFVAFLLTAACGWLGSSAFAKRVHASDALRLYHHANKTTAAYAKSLSSLERYCTILQNSSSLDLSNISPDTQAAVLDGLATRLGFDYNSQLPHQGTGGWQRKFSWVFLLWRYPPKTQRQLRPKAPRNERGCVSQTFVSLTRQATSQKNLVNLLHDSRVLQRGHVLVRLNGTACRLFIRLSIDLVVSRLGVTGGYLLILFPMCVL